MSNQLIFYAFLGGVLPSILWLWFWLKEDKINPEPKKYIILTFFFGALTAALVLPVEEFIVKFLPETGLITVLALSFAEEIFKYWGAYFVALRKKFTDEPIDAVIYMITIALGFAALENTLFLIHSIKTGGELAQTIIVGNMRFIGATILHTAASGLIGLFLALSFYKSRRVKKIYLLSGVILAVILHAFFNSLIIKLQGVKIFGVFLFVWLAMAVLIILFEIVKRVQAKKINHN